MKTLEFALTTSVPCGLPGWTQLPRLAAATGAQVLINLPCWPRCWRAGLDAELAGSGRATPRKRNSKSTQRQSGRRVWCAHFFFVGEHMFWAKIGSILF